MLDGRQAYARGILDHGVQAGVDDGLARDRDAVVAVLDVGAHEDDARPGRSRPDRQARAPPGMHADAGADGRTRQGVFVLILDGRRHGETSETQLAGRHTGNRSTPLTVSAVRQKPSQVSLCFGIRPPGETTARDVSRAARIR
jgi:hypothetical protein